MKSIMKKTCTIILMLAMLVTGIGELSSVMLAKASDTSTVTMEDGVKYVKYEDISEYRTTQDENGYYTNSPKQSGYIFGGWFADAAETSTIGTATSGSAWAKFVPEETFTVKGQISIAAPTSGVGFSDLLTSVQEVNLRLVTSVDSLKYQKVIFQMTNLTKTVEHEMTSVMSQIDVKNEEDSTYDSKNASDVFGTAAEYFATIRITGIAATADRYLKDWTITPMVVTQDGTLVKGITREEMKISDALPFQLESSTSGITANYSTGTVTVNLSDGEVKNQFFAIGNETNSSKYWEITGSLKVITAHVKGFTIQAADGSKTGFYTFWDNAVSLNQNWGWPVYTETDPWNLYAADGVYVHSNADYNALGGANVEKRFKAVIKDDIFSFWVEDQLVWELPLTNEQFGGFAQGTAYRFALRHLDNGGQAEWSDLKVKCGQKILVADKTSRVTADRINGTVVTNGAGAVARETLYFATDNATNSDDSWKITGTVKQDGEGLKEFVIQSADGTKTEYYVIYDEHLLMWEDTGFVWYAWYTFPDYVFNGNTLLTTTHDPMTFKAVIENDQFTVWLKGGRIWSVPLTDSRFGGFEAGTSYRLGLGVFNGDAQVTWSDLTVTHHNEFAVGTMTSGMKAECVAGRVTGTGSGAGNRETLYFGTDNETDSSDYWEIAGNLKQSGEALKEFVIQSADGTKTEYYVIYDEHLLMWVNDHFEWYAWYNFPDYVFNGNTGLTTSHDSMTFKAVIEDDQFTVSLKGGRIWSVPLTDSRFGGFEAGTSYRLGLGVFNGSAQVTWSDLTVKY